MDKIRADITGGKLYSIGMALQKDDVLTVVYSSVKKRQSAICGCSNKCRIEGIKNLFTLHQWQDNEDCCVTITKSPKGILTEANILAFIKSHSRAIPAQGGENEAGNTNS